MTIDHVHALDVVLSDGTRTRFGPRTAGAARRDARSTGGLPRAACVEATSGDRRGLPEVLAPVRRLPAGPAGARGRSTWRSFVVGSEGTLAASPRPTVELVALPKAQVFAVGHFDSVHGGDRGDRRRAGAATPAAVELIDRTILGSRARSSSTRALAERPRRRSGGAAVRDVLRRQPRPRRAAGSSGWTRAGSATATATTRCAAETAAEQAALLKVRKAGLGLLMAASDGRAAAAGVRRGHRGRARASSATYVARFRQMLDAPRPDGRLLRPLLGRLPAHPPVHRPLDARRQVETMRAVAEEVVDLVLRVRRRELQRARRRARAQRVQPRASSATTLYAAMREVKQLFDPRRAAEPGQDGRRAADDRTTCATPALPAREPLRHDAPFDAPGGMRGAADRCMRIGACRKTDAASCARRTWPRATRSTPPAAARTRSSRRCRMPDPRAALGDERLHEILDLCLECKACKSECPLSVDMAALKSEFAGRTTTHQHGVPLRSRLFGSIRTLNRLGAATAPLSNLPPVPPARPLQKRCSGSRRAAAAAVRARDAAALVPAARAPARRASARRGRLPRRLVHDLHRARDRPRGDRAARARRVAACGSRARGLLRPLEPLQGPAGSGPADGRAAWPRGWRPTAERGVPIVGCEPSCLLTLREEYLALLPGDPRAQAVGGARRAGGGAARGGHRRRRAAAAGVAVRGRAIVFHGHCHQKALAGTAATVALLRSIPGADVTELDAGLLRHGRLVRLRGRALRTVDADRRDAGSSRRSGPAPRRRSSRRPACRAASRSRHGVGMRAAHPVELVREALAR